MALKTVLEALIAEEEDEETQQRLRKKEYKSAEEERRLRKSKDEPKKCAPEARPMELDLSPKEVLQVLPVHVIGGEASLV